MTTTYCSTEDVTQYYTGKFRKISGDNTYVALKADSGASETNKDRINLTAAHAGLFYIGDSVRVFDDGAPVGELGVVEAVTFSGDSSYLVVITDLTGDYETTDNAKVQLRSLFNKDSDPDVAIVHKMINDAEDWIDNTTHHAWRSKTVTEEYHHRPRRRASLWPGTAIPLNHRTITTMVSGTDKIEVFEGTAGTWTDWVASKTSGRANDYWLNYTDGIIYLKAWYLRHQTDAVRVTYRYGETSVPNDIRKCCAMIVAKELLAKEQHLNNMPAETGQGYTFGSDPRIREYQRTIDRIISRHTEIIAFHE